MKTVGIIGLGNMGMGMAKNLLTKGFAVNGYDLRKEVLDELKSLGGVPASSAAELAAGCDVVFFMVLNGKQVLDILEGGFKQKIKKGSTIIITATIGQSFVKQIEAIVIAAGADILDMPVSGGKYGAHGGTLTLMASGKKQVFEAHQDVMQAIAKSIFYVGGEIGQGQVVKACLAIMVGSSYEALFESMVLSAKAGLDPEMLSMVMNSSVVASNLTKNTTEYIMDRKFVNTGSHISTMYKDFGISMAMAKELGVPMPAASVVMEMFQAGITAIPEGDNWCIVQLLEKLAATEVHRREK
jgi:3-hydroxyisobutyrate dehydrogenase-like beta-hydroxyacid dehydrogenase